MNPITTNQPLCPFCASPIDATDMFCPACGKSVKEKPLSTSTWNQILLYSVSILLPPLFIVWTIKYIKSKDLQKKKIGYISLGLNILSIVFALWFTIAFTKNLTKEIDRQLNQYQTIGF